MLKQRIIFTLLYCDGFFCQSRNFNLQKIGNIDWLLNNYNFDNISTYIDEIIILDISRENKNRNKFLKDVNRLIKKCFIPITLGGGINKFELAQELLSSGADKILLSTSVFENKSLINEISTNYGDQSIIINLDYKKINNNYFLFKNNGFEKIEIDLNIFFKNLVKFKFGELILNSITNDGTGMGLDVGILELIPKNFIKPLIISGGVGNYRHIIEGLNNSKISAVATANLLNFVGDGLKITRDKLIEKKFDFPIWDKNIILGKHKKFY